MSELIYRQRLEAVLSVIQRYLPPDGISKDEAISEIISLVDPMPPAQEDEPVGETIYELHHGHETRKAFLYRNGIELPDGTQLYAHPQSDELRKAAEEVLDCYDTRYPVPIPAARMFALICNLRAALEKGQA